MSVTLLMIDVQRNMLEPPAPVPEAASVGSAITSVLGQARRSGWTIVHVRNNGTAEDPDATGARGWELVHPVESGEHVVDKHWPDAFTDTDLANIVGPSAVIVLVGMQSDFCIRETALAALRRGHAVHLVSDAHATYDDELPAREEARRVERELAEAGTDIVSSSMMAPTSTSGPGMRENRPRA